MNIFSISSSAKIDPETGEVLHLHSQEQASVKVSSIKGFIQKNIAFVLLFILVLNASTTGFVYYYLKNDISFMHTQFDSLFVGVEESEARVEQMMVNVEEMNNKITEVLEEDEEFASKNFWGDAQTASHLQSIKYIGFYEVNRQRIAYTKSQLGDRFLTQNEAFNDHWRVKEITETQLTLVGENDKTYTIHKLENE
jgi:hypothetical protein